MRLTRGQAWVKHFGISSVNASQIPKTAERIEKIQRAPYGITIALPRFEQREHVALGVGLLHTSVG